MLAIQAMQWFFWQKANGAFPHDFVFDFRIRDRWIFRIVRTKSCSWNSTINKSENAEIIQKNEIKIKITNFSRRMFLSQL